jgi:hypothetical protein
MATSRNTSTRPPPGQIIAAINAPLGFYVLSLLIVETFLGTVLLGPSGLGVPEKVILVYVGVGLFILVFTVVSLLVWFKASNLTFGAKEHLDVATRAVNTPEPQTSTTQVKRKARPKAEKEEE